MITGFGNNVVSALAANITATQTTIGVMPGGGALFAACLTSDQENSSNPLEVYAKITLTDAEETVYEICHLTAVAGDTLTVIRGQEGTTAKGWSLNDEVSNFATRGSENNFVQIEHLQSGHYTTAVAGGTENALTIDLPTTFFVNGQTDWQLKTPLMIIPTLSNTGASTVQLTLSGMVVGVFPIYKGQSAELVAGDIIAGIPLLCVMNAEKTFLQITNPGTYSGLGTAAFRDVQTNEADTAEGRVLIAGYWHLSKGIQFVPLLTQASLYPGVFAIDGGANQDMVFSDAHFGTEVGKYIYEGAVRVYSPNNPPPATDLSAYMKTADANAKFVQGIRQGTQGGMTIQSDQDVFAPDGSYAMGYHAEGENPGGDTMYYRALQANVNGTWSTIGYNTASPNPLVAVSDIPHAGISRLSNLKVYRPDEDWPEYLMNFIDDAGYPWHLVSQVLEGNVFIAYDSAGVIQQIDADATMLTPQNLSVAGLASVPDGCHINGAWKFDGEAVYLDSGIASAETLRVNTAKYNALAGRAVTFIAMINASAALGNSRDGDNLLELQQYADALRDVDLTATDPDWPEPPSFMQ